MKKILFLSYIIIIACNSKSQQKPLEVNEVKSSSGEIILLGEINLANLQTSSVTPWFNDEFDRVNINFNKAKDLKPFTKGLKILVFMGTWCDDSHRELPPFFKMLLAMNFDQKHLKYLRCLRKKAPRLILNKDLKLTTSPRLFFLKMGRKSIDL